MIAIESVLGVSSEHISFDLNECIACPVHYDVVAPFLKLQSDAKLAGFDLQLVSGFRDFDRQLKIFKAKASGQRNLLDSQGDPLAFNALNKNQLLDAILRWSALPGASRHHWGTDIDVFDASSVADDYDVQLTPAEVEGDGPFSAMHDWLDTQIETGAAHAFFRPYAKDLGGIAPERWHLSYAPISSVFQQALSKKTLMNAWQEVNLPLFSEIEKRIDTIWEKYIWVQGDCYP